MKKLILKLIRAYQTTRFFHAPIFRFFLIPNDQCRFTPTCSEYMYQAVKKHGSLKGLFLGTIRIIRCNPLSKGGFDPVK